MRLLLADDHALFRDALVQYIERADPGSIIMLARDMQEVMELMEGAPDLDLVLLDLKMPGMNGLQGLAKLRDCWPGTRVALMSGVAEKQDVEQAMKLGAVAYFPKTMSGKAMMNGIGKVLEGEIFIPIDHNTGSIMPSYYGASPAAHSSRSSQDAGVRDAGQDSIAGMPVPLTPREREVLAYLIRGETNKDIARALDLQTVTVKLHIRGICRKLGAKNRTQAALLAKEKGLG